MNTYFERLVKVLRLVELLPEVLALLLLLLHLINQSFFMLKLRPSWLSQIKTLLVTQFDWDSSSVKSSLLPNADKFGK